MAEQSHDHSIEVIVNKKKVLLPSEQETGSQILAVAELPPDFQLFIEHGEELEPVAYDQEIKVHKGERFTAVSGQEVS